MRISLSIAQFESAMLPKDDPYDRQPNTNPHPVENDVTTDELAANEDVDTAVSYEIDRLLDNKQPDAAAVNPRRNISSNGENIIILKTHDMTSRT